MIAAGTPAPEFTLTKEDGEKFSRADLLGHTSVLVFYPFAFSPVCNDQLTLYEEVLDEFTSRGATLYAISTDARSAIWRVVSQASGNSAKRWRISAADFK